MESANWELVETFLYSYMEIIKENIYLHYSSNNSTPLQKTEPSFSGQWQVDMVLVYGHDGCC